MDLAEDGFIPMLMSHFIMMHDATRTLSKTILNIEKVKQLEFHFHILAQVAKMTILYHLPSSRVGHQLVKWSGALAWNRPKRPWD